MALLVLLCLVAGLKAVRVRTVSPRTWVREFLLGCLSVALVLWLLPAALEAPLRDRLGMTPLSGLALVLPLGLLLGWILMTLLEHGLMRLLGPSLGPAFGWRLALNAGLVTCLAAGSCLSGSASLLLHYRLVQPGHLPPVEVWFLAQGGVHCLRPWTGRPPSLILALDLPPGTRLDVIRNEDSWHLAAVRPDHSVQVLQADFAPAGAAIAHHTSGFTDRSGHLALVEARLMDCYGPAALLPGPEEAGLRVRAGYSPSEGLTSADEFGLWQQRKLDVPLAHWEIRCVSVVEGRWVFFQAGPQLALWDMVSGHVHALARGASPLVLQRRP